MLWHLHKIESTVSQIRNKIQILSLTGSETAASLSPNKFEYLSKQSNFASFLVLTDP